MRLHDPLGVNPSIRIFRPFWSFANEILEAIEACFLMPSRSLNPHSYAFLQYLAMVAFV